MSKLRQQPSASRPGFSAFVKYVLGACLLLAATSLATADDDEAWVSDTLSGDHQKQQFVAGQRVEVRNARVADDIFAAGRDLKFDTVSAKFIVAAGASLWFRNVDADDLILAGAEMDLSGTVKDDVIAAVCPVCPIGGRLRLTNSMQVGDDARLAGREVRVDGKVGGDLYAAAQDFELSGEVAGTARIEAERIVLASGARIGGDLRWAGPNAPELREGAVVAGRIVQVESRIPFEDEAAEHAVWWYVVLAVLALLGFLLALILLGAVLQLAVPGLLAGAAATASTAMWASLGRGLVVALLAPAAVALLMVSVIGIPIGLVGVASLVLLYALAYVTACYWIGLFVRRRFGKTNVVAGAGARILWTAAGIVILGIVGLVPFLGWTIGVLACIAGLGAVVSELGLLFRKSSGSLTGG